MDIFNPLRVFTKEPITKQEIKWECMNKYQNTFKNLESNPSFLRIRRFTHTHWAISNNGFLLDSLYGKKIGEDLVFNNAFPKSLTITQIACLKTKPKLHNGMVYRQFIMIPLALIDATNYVYKCIAT